MLSPFCVENNCLTSKARARKFFHLLKGPLFTNADPSGNSVFLARIERALERCSHGLNTFSGLVKFNYFWSEFLLKLKKFFI